jgi:hypothetical protein
MKEGLHRVGNAMMAKAAGVSVSSVQRIWRAHGLAPHRTRQQPGARALVRRHFLREFERAANGKIGV